MSAIDHTEYFASRLLAPSGRTRIRSQRPWAPSGPCDPDFLLLPLALARRLEQAEHRLRHIGIADEDALDRAHLLGGRGPRQRQIGGVGIDDVAAGIGDREPVMGVVGDPAHHRIVGGAVGEADDAGGKGEQIEQADHGQQRQHAEDIGLGLGAADGHQHDRDRDDAGGHQQHQHDAAATPRRLMGREGLGGRMAVGFGGHIRGRKPVGMGWRADLRASLECLNRTGKRKSIRRLIGINSGFKRNGHRFE